MSSIIKSANNPNGLKEWMQRISARSYNPVMYVDNANVSNSAGVETDLHSFTLPTIPGGYYWRGEGQGVRVTSYGSFASNANTKTLKLYTGASSLYSFSQAINGGEYKLVVEINRIDVSSYEVFGVLVTSNATYPTHVMRLGLAAAGTRLSPGTLKTTGNGAGASDITESYFRVEQFYGPDSY